VRARYLSFGPSVARRARSAAALGAFHEIEHLVELVDGFAVDGSGAGAGVGDGYRRRAEDGDLAVGGEEIEVAALNVAQDHPDDGDGFSGAVIAFDGDAHADLLEWRANSSECRFCGVDCFGALVVFLSFWHFSHFNVTHLLTVCQSRDDSQGTGTRKEIHGRSRISGPRAHLLRR
jgi:hypothetical protein